MEQRLIQPRSAPEPFIAVDEMGAKKSVSVDFSSQGTVAT
jgi:hypothetical protein